jgi:hypothetical protein
MNIFQKIASAVSGFFTKEKPVVESAFSAAVGVVNIVKTFLGSATGQTIEAIIEVVAPGAGIAVITALNTFFTDFGIVTAEASKTPSQLAADGLNAISKLTGDSKTLALSNVSSIIGHAISSINAGASTLQQAIVSIPLVYNPETLGDTSAPIAQAPIAPITIQEPAPTSNEAPGIVSQPENVVGTASVGRPVLPGDSQPNN